MKTRIPLIAAFLAVGVIHLNAATITFTTVNDSGAGSLRAALASAANGDAIDASGVSGTILLTSGELLVTNSLTILGPGAANLAVDGNAASGVFHIIGSNIVVSISSLTITNGHAAGTGFPSNSGGGIRNDRGTLTIANCTISGNAADNEGGGILNSDGTLTVSNSTLSGNSAVHVGGGAIANFSFIIVSATLTIADSTISGNSTSGSGGGILAVGTLTVINSTLSGNSARLDGGGIENVGTLTVINSTLSGNRTGSTGGGILNDGTGTVINSTLSGNSADGSGGGILNFFGTLTVINSTLSGNSAGNSAGNEGGGIWIEAGAVTVINSTLSGNLAGGILNFFGTLEIGNTILKGGASGANISIFFGTVTSDGYNLSSDDGGGFLTGPADQINTDPMLGPLQDNGGPTFTHALLCGSPAIDKGKTFSASATDQRGLPRTFDQFGIANASDGTDIGAFELQTACLPPCTDTSFTQPAGSPVGAGSNPFSVAVGDFNGDGKPDLAVANFGSDNVTILLGNGSGGFSQPAGSPVSAGSYPISVAVGYFNGDSKPDLAVANYGSANVTILLGDGSGGFSQPAGSPVSTGSSPESVAVGDFNGDGTPDLAVVNTGSANVTILLGNGSGGFSQPAGSPVGAGTNPSSVAVGDFNGDGKTDLAVANSGSANVTILLGDGSGGFSQPAGSPVGAGVEPLSVAVGDFNGDGKPDLAVANEGSANVTILLGDGSGGFSQPAGSPVGVGNDPRSVAVGDFNGDGKTDLAVANGNSANMPILLGDGSGGFSQPAGSPVGAGSYPISVAVGDFNGDGKPDLAVANFDSANVAILVNTCTANHPPMAQCRNVTVSAGPDCTANASIDNGSFDPDTGDTITLTQSPSGPYGLGSRQVTLTVVDNHGASNSCTATVSVIDTTPPQITCPANIVTNATSPAGAVVSFEPTASDNCSLASVTSTPPSGSTFPIGTTTVTCRAIDVGGNTTTCTFTVTVRGPRAIDVDVLTQLQALRATVTDKDQLHKLDEAIGKLTEANNPAYWIDDTHLQPKQGDHVFDAMKDGVQKLGELAKKNPALAPGLQSLIAREVLAARILVQVVLPGASGHDLQEALKELADGDSRTNPHDAIDHYKNAWKHALHQ